MNPCKQIDKQIADLTDWRGKLFAQLRKLILESDKEMVEEWKWSTAVWSCRGLVCAVGTFKDKIKLNFFQGASLKDKHKLFNAGLEAKATRAIDFFEGDKVDESSMRDLINEAVTYNANGGK